MLVALAKMESRIWSVLNPASYSLWRQLLLTYEVAEEGEDVQQELCLLPGPEVVDVVTVCDGQQHIRRLSRVQNSLQHHEET